GTGAADLQTAFPLQGPLNPAVIPKPSGPPPVLGKNIRHQRSLPSGGDDSAGFDRQSLHRRRSTRHPSCSTERSRTTMPHAPFPHAPFIDVPGAIAEIQAGRMVVVVDDEDRENEGDLTLAAEFVTPEGINFMARYGRGLICLTLTEERADYLRLPPMA